MTILPDSAIGANKTASTLSFPLDSVFPCLNPSSLRVFVVTSYLITTVRCINAANSRSSALQKGLYFLIGDAIKTAASFVVLLSYSSFCKNTSL